LGLFSPKVKEFDDILQKVHFAGCIDLLVKWKVIKPNLERKIKQLTKVRNQLAHSWSESDVHYKKDTKEIPSVSTTI
jgi:uncharacterized protein YutE (UPF0331/DUF86 family)